MAAQSEKTRSDRESEAAAVVAKIADFFGGKRTLATKLGGAISRPLIVALTTGAKRTTAANVAAICKVCPPALAAELVAAHLNDELERIRINYGAGAPSWKPDAGRKRNGVRRASR